MDVFPDNTIHVCKTISGLSKDEWVHFVFTYSSTEGKAYLNNDSPSVDGSVPSYPSGYFGNNSFELLQNFNGQISDLRIYG